MSATVPKGSQSSNTQFRSCRHPWLPALSFMLRRGSFIGWLQRRLRSIEISTTAWSCYQNSWGSHRKPSRPEDAGLPPAHIGLHQIRIVAVQRQSPKSDNPTILSALKIQNLDMSTSPSQTYGFGTWRTAICLNLSMKLLAHRLRWHLISPKGKSIRTSEWRRS